MKVAAVLCLAALATAVKITESEGVNPIRRIVNIMQKMQKESAAEGEKEEEMMAKFNCYCKTETDRLNADIAGNKDSFSALSEEGKAKQGECDKLRAEVASHKDDRSEAEDGIAKASAMRKKESGEFAAKENDLNTNIAALGRAIPALEKGMAGSFLQAQTNKDMISRVMLASQSVTDAERQIVTSFLANKNPFGDYESASGEIVGILKTMKEEMEKDLAEAQEGEADAQSQHNEMVAAKTDIMNSSTAAIEAKSVRAGDVEVEAVKARNAAGQKKTELGGNTEFLANLTKDCEAKNKGYDARVAARNEESVAINDAIGILNNDDALDVFKKNVPASFVQVSDVKRTKAIATLQQTASIAGKRAAHISLLGYLLKQGANFDVILKKIDDMVGVLKAEGKNDQVEKERCQEQADSNADDHKALTRKVDGLASAIESLKAKSAAAADGIKKVQEEMAANRKAAAEASENRKDENTEWVNVTKPGLIAAKQILGKALNRLNKLYNPAMYKPPPQRQLTEEERIAQSMGEVIPTEAPEMIAGTTMTVLEQQPAAPSGEFKKSNKSSGVLGLMEMMMKDIDTQLSDGDHEENEAQADYEAVQKASQKQEAENKEELTGLQGSMSEADGDLADLSSKKTGKDAELVALNQAIALLTADCSFLLNNFEMRREARAKEIDGMKNAKAILSGADFA